jgi:hypothetical protein
MTDLNVPLSSSLKALREKAESEIARIGPVYLYRSQYEQDAAQRTVNYHKGVLALLLRCEELEQWQARIVELIAKWRRDGFDPTTYGTWANIAAQELERAASPAQEQP